MVIYSLAFFPLANTDLVILLLTGLTPESMKVYKQLNKRTCCVSVKKIDINKLSDIVKEWLANSEKRRREIEAKKEATRLKKKLKVEQALRFEPYKPKITTNYHIKSQSSVSMLQSFTSAVQQLCLPQKNGSAGTSASATSSSSSSATGGARHRAIKEPLMELDDFYDMVQENKNKVQCIDLCSSSDDEKSESASR